MSSIDPLTWVFAVVVLAAAALALIAVRGALSVRLRCGAVVLAAVLMAAGYGGLTELMARPKPATLEWVRGYVDTVKVAASHLRENEAIYLWLLFDGETEPRAYRLPWSMETARQLRDAQRTAERRNGEVRMKSPFRKRNAKTDTIFHAPPRPPLPAKTAGAS